MNQYTRDIIFVSQLVINLFGIYHSIVILKMSKLFNGTSSLPIDNLVGNVYLSAKNILCNFKQNNQQNVIE